MKRSIILLFCYSLFWYRAEGAEQLKPAPLDASYKLVFADDFDGQSINLGNWKVIATNHIGGGYSKNSLVKENVVVADGFLNLLATRGLPGKRPYRSGFIVSQKSWSFGYWEARMKMPEKAKGVWPAFWMNKGGTYPEIDIFEWLGNKPKTQWLTYHPVDDVALTKGFGLGKEHDGPDFSADFHVFGMWWQPDKIVWYVDGVEVFTLKQGETFKDKKVDITATAMDTILNCSVGGWNKNVVDDTTVFPARLLVDYVRIYSNDPKLPEVTSSHVANGVKP
ncbi:MAG: family 16 glycosylhydrolase [Candidatus Methylacidiphilales bacterium]|nr:glycoside hydrolase family 16 protein [Candidatus Methylacidiphilales bacterium]